MHSSMTYYLDTLCRSEYGQSLDVGNIAAFPSVPLLSSSPSLQFLSSVRQHNKDHNVNNAA